MNAAVAAPAALPLKSTATRLRPMSKTLPERVPDLGGPHDAAAPLTALRGLGTMG